MNISQPQTPVGLCWLIALLAFCAASVGLFWQDGGSSFSFTTLRGQEVQIYGQGLYRYDSLFVGAGYKGQDAATLFLGVPLLIFLTYWYQRGSLKGGLLLTGILAYFLYAYASMALGAAYNGLFLLYVLLFSASLFAFGLTFTQVLGGLSRLETAHLPSRWPALLLYACGLLTSLVWLGPLVAALLQNGPPYLLGASATMVTDALDLAIITPSTLVAGWLVGRRAPLGYGLAFALFGLIVMLVPVIGLGTLSQLQAGIAFSTGEIIGPISGFLTLGLLAIWAMVSILHRLPDSPGRPTPGNRAF